MGSQRSVPRMTRNEKLTKKTKKDEHKNLVKVILKAVQRVLR